MPRFNNCLSMILLLSVDGHYRSTIGLKHSPELTSACAQKMYSVSQMACVRWPLGDSEGQVAGWEVTVERILR